MQPTQTTGSLGGRRSTSHPTYVLEFQVSELADGVTPAPQYELDGQIPSDGAFPDSEQIYVIPVARLGLIDLSVSGILPEPLASAPSGLGQRYVTWAWARGFVLANASPLQKSNDIQPEGYVNLQALETLPLGSTQFYSRKGYVMPHGTVLRLNNMAPLVQGEPFILRLGVYVPLSVRDDALLRAALCCTEDVPTTTDSDADCVTPSITSVSPNQLTPGVSTLDIEAYPVQPDADVTVVGPGGPVALSNVEVIFPDTLRITGSFTVEGNYNVTVSNGTGCDDTLNNAFTVGS
jgi:hypothetical protein